MCADCDAAMVTDPGPGECAACGGPDGCLWYHWADVPARVAVTARVCPRCMKTGNVSAAANLRAATRAAPRRPGGPPADPADTAKALPPTRSQGTPAPAAPETPQDRADPVTGRPGILCFNVSDLPEVITRRGVTLDEASGCWRVGGYHDEDGYARIRGENAARVVWRALVGEIPADRPVIDHVAARGCAWRDCCRPDHLEPVTVRVNTMRGRSFAAVNAAKTECVHGHPFDLLGTYWRPDGHRDCRVCIRDRVRRYKQRKRQRAAAARLPAASRAELGRAA